MIKKDINEKQESGNKEYTAEEKAREEGEKLYYDAMKHLTTLSTGAILILVGFIEKVFKQPRWKMLIIIALGSFVISIIASFASMVHSANYIQNFAKVDQGMLRRGEKTFYLAIIVFVIGILSLASFAFRNSF